MKFRLYYYTLLFLIAVIRSNKIALLTALENVIVLHFFVTNIEFDKNIQILILLF